MLPTADELKVMIRQALHDAAVNYDKVGVKDWLAKNAESEVKKLKDITTNIRNDFKSVARILALPLYDLVVPIQCRDQEAALRRQRVPVLCSDFTWLDSDFMVCLFHIMNCVSYDPTSRMSWVRLGCPSVIWRSRKSSSTYSGAKSNIGATFQLEILILLGSSCSLGQFYIRY
ncbi:hypothetical protein EDD17DRAFT_1187094 [Pisolithus thermaeus]|nr:hypothetical protein EDD17DRAFT_1187094 [Pisolithus thermaeus]